MSVQYKEAAMDATIAPAMRPYALAAGEGEAIWYVNNRATILATAAQTGGAFGLVHMEVAVGHGTPARLLVLLTPGGGEGYFVEAGRPAAGPGLPPPAPPDVAMLAAIGAKYHQENIGPP